MATPAKEFKVIALLRLPSSEAKRLGKYDRVVTYELDPTHRSTVTVPEESFTEEALAAAVKKDIAERAEWLGKTFRL